VDIKRLGRFHVPGKAVRGDRIHRNVGAGWQYLHVAIDDHTRLAYAEILSGQGEREAAGFVARATRWFADHGIATERILSDNGSCYRSRLWRATLESLGIAPKYTRPRRPQTNGKAEALIKTMLREWAYRYAYPSSAHRAKALSGWLRWYNRRRPHGSLGGRPPMSRVAQVRGAFI
jgi:transposase InsO family protein